MDTIITVNNLTKCFGEKTAVDAVSFSVPCGSVFGFLGTNGAGKTTTIKMLLGLLRPTQGTIRVLNEPVPEQIASIRSRIGVLLENNGIYGRLTVRENVAFFGAAYGMGKAETEKRGTELLEWLGLVHVWDRPAWMLSTGESRKLGILRAFIHQPELIVLDEPTLGLDVESAVSLRETLTKLVSTDGVTVFLTTHHLNEIERLCDRVVVLRNGRVVADTTPHELATRSQKPLVSVKAEGLTSSALTQVRSLPGVKNVDISNSEIRVEYESSPDSGALVSALVASGAIVREVRSDQGEFERAFIDLMREKESA
jgi:ABC-2 type transport system ATP-binding protein